MHTARDRYQYNWFFTQIRPFSYKSIAQCTQVPLHFGINFAESSAGALSLSFSFLFFLLRCQIYINYIIVKRIAKVTIYFECVCFGEFKFEEELAMPFVPKCFCFGCWDWEWIVESLPREILIYPVHSIWRLSSPILIVVVVVISGGGDCGTNCPCTVYGGHSCSRAGWISGQW